MADARASSLVAQAAGLERRDDELAAAIDVVSGLAERAHAIRARAAAVRSALERLPREREELARRAVAVEAEIGAAREELRLAEERLATLERARRRKTEEIERARKEVATAQERLADTEALLERAHEREAQLRVDEGTLREESDGLVGAASEVATELRGAARVPDAAGDEPGGTLAELEEWGFLVRSTLFVARGTLEAERERVVAEANALGAAALGEDLGGASVALVRRRLEAELPRSL